MIYQYTTAIRIKDFSLLENKTFLALTYTWGKRWVYDDVLELTIPSLKTLKPTYLRVLFKSFTKSYVQIQNLELTPQGVTRNNISAGDGAVISGVSQRCG